VRRPGIDAVRRTEPWAFDYADRGLRVPTAGRFMECERTGGHTPPRLTGRPMSTLFRSLFLVLLAARAVPAWAGSIAIADACGNDTLFAAGFEPSNACYVADDSAGSGGDKAAGDHTVAVVVPELGASRTYSYRLPADYNPEEPIALLVALHGSASNVALAAATLRANWGFVADAERFIVLTPLGTGSGGGWRGNDAYAIAAAVADLESRYRVDRRRRYLWGYSAGAHFGHAVVLDDPEPWAAYGVSAGALTQYACGVSGAPACEPWLASAAARNRLPVSISIGTQDPLYPYASGDPARFASAGWQGAELRYAEFSGGHAYYLPHLVDAWAFLGQYAQAR
jgi:poly(3-hydroxybutyrate) depolymerase